MRTSIFQVDAFTTWRTAGNPAAVMPLESFLTDAMRQTISAEKNLDLLARVDRGLPPEHESLLRPEASNLKY